MENQNLRHNENEATKVLKSDINDSIQRIDEHHIERHNYFMNFKESNKIDLLFLGDSITRRWVEVPQLWDMYFSKYNPANFGVGCDTIQNLKWRMENGELDGIQPKIVVLFIGTNNLPLYSPEEVSQGIAGLLNIIKCKLPDSKIILMGLLPRDADDQCNDYLKIVEEVNTNLLSLANDNDIIFLDIGKEFLNENNTVNRALLPDGLHMIEPGYKIWGDKIYGIISDNF